MSDHQIELLAQAIRLLCTIDRPDDREIMKTHLTVILLLNEIIEDETLFRTAIVDLTE